MAVSLADDKDAIGRLISEYYSAFQGENPKAVTQCLVFPYTFWVEGVLIALNNENEFGEWWTTYLNKLKVETGFVRGEILKLDIEQLSDTAGLVRMLSSRLGTNDKLISRVQTGFIVYKTSDSWKVAALISNLRE